MPLLWQVMMRLIILKEYIGKEFEIKDVGDLNFGTEVARFKDDIEITQWKYTSDSLKEIGGAKPTESPIKQNHGLDHER